MISLLLILGLITYFIVQRSVAGITRTPVWLLWLVMMAPALIWTMWTLRYGQNTPPPPLLVLVPIIICPLIYWWLIQLGRRGMPQQPPQQPTEQVTSATLPSKDAPENKLRPFSRDEETQLQGCFPWSVYYLQDIEYRPQVVICKGQLRTNSTNAYETIKKNIEGQFGDRFLVVFQEGPNGKPFFTLFPNPQAKGKAKPERLTRPLLAFGLLAATLLTTTLVGAVAIVQVSEVALENDPSLLLSGLAYALPLLIILGIHELGHYLTARFYRIRATLPYFIPVPFFLGTFGAFIQIRSPVPNRKALFDVGISGPVSGLVATIPFLLWGLSQSEIVPLTDEASILNFNALDPKSSFVIALLSKLVLGSSLTATSALKLHPVAVAGCLGLVVTALNLMPVGQLDGGHIVHAMYGQRTAAVVGQVARFLVLILAFVQRAFLFWAVILLLMPIYDEPALNDVSELDSRRDLSGLLVLFLLLAIILPAPPFVAQLLYR
ncbi:MAG: site-2 protease family protein [Desertifilum sp. SIO1I2]|nr:site-2 protease family protein [Desertifilum sp. SIO1I2]